MLIPKDKAFRRQITSVFLLLALAGVFIGAGVILVDTRTAGMAFGDTGRTTSPQIGEDGRTTGRFLGQSYDFYLPGQDTLQVIGQQAAALLPPELRLAAAAAGHAGEQVPKIVKQIEEWLF